MTTYNVELRGTITRDIKYVEVDASTEAEARAICAVEMPRYRIHTIAARPKQEPSP